jgi:C-terminal processing protease CtpA/Prc
VVAEVRDGHGNVYDVAAGQPIGTLPLQLRMLDGRLIVTGSGQPDVPIGSVVKAIDDTPAADRFAKEVQLASGTMQWKQYRAARDVLTCRAGSTVKLSIEQPSGSAKDATLSCQRYTARLLESRPDTIAELEPGIWYVDVTRARMAQVRAMLDKLASARGVVFDLRGYPTEAGRQILPHLISAAEDDRWMHVSRISGPFGEIGDWQSMSWNVGPATPRIASRRVFLTDGRAISYAESVMGYVRDHKLATIIGSTTAGTNGNIADFAVPGGFTIVFTGMRVTRHDGRTPFHLVGVSPDIPLEPTLAGIRAGRDEVLERALAVLRLPQP